MLSPPREIDEKKKYKSNRKTKRQKSKFGRWSKLEWNWERFTCWFQLDWIIFTFIWPNIKIIMKNKNEKQKEIGISYSMRELKENMLHKKFNLEHFNAFHLELQWNWDEWIGDNFLWFSFQIFNFDFTLFLCERLFDHGSHKMMMNFAHTSYIFSLYSLYISYLISSFYILSYELKNIWIPMKIGESPTIQSEFQIWNDGNWSKVQAKRVNCS